MMVDVAVLGGGISGLATAWELVRRGRNVVVLERQARAGGKAISERIDGFLMEHGPSSVSAAAGAAAVLSADLDLDRQHVDLGAGVKRRYLTKGGALCGIATHPLAFIASSYLPLGARLRVAAEALVPARRSADEETVEQFWRRRFGQKFVDRVIDPLVAGLLAGRPGDLSMKAVFPQIAAMERRHGSIALGMVSSLLRGGRMPARRLFSWRNGIGTLPDRIAELLGPAVRTGVAVRRIVPCGRVIRIETGGLGTIHAGTVVLATQPTVAAALLGGVDEAGAEAAAAIGAPPLAVVFLAYPRSQVAHPLDGLGYLTPAQEGRALSGALFCSTMFAGRAPDGYVALAGYVGGARAPGLAMEPAGALIDAARAEFKDLLGARGDPVLARVRQWPVGLPQYRPGHARHVAALTSIADRVPGLYVTGNYLAGVSIGACLTQANETAVAVDGVLKRRDTERVPVTRRQQATSA